MDEMTQEAFVQLHAHIQALTAVLIAGGITTEETLKRLSDQALEELKMKLAPSK